MIRFSKLSARIDGNELLIEHANGGVVRIPLKRLESWLMRMFRAEM